MGEGGGAPRNPLLPAGIYISKTALSAQLGIGCSMRSWLMTGRLTALTSFNEHLYFLMKTTLQWVREVVRFSKQVAASPLTSTPTLIYGRNLFRRYWRGRVAEMGMLQNTKIKSMASTSIRMVDFWQCCPDFAHFAVIRKQIKRLTNPKTPLMWNQTHVTGQICKQKHNARFFWLLRLKEWLWMKVTERLLYRNPALLKAHSEKVPGANSPGMFSQCPWVLLSATPASSHRPKTSVLFTLN